MATLFEIVDDLQNIYDMATDPEVDPEVFQDTLEAVKGSLEVKACGIANLIKQIEMEQKQAEEVSKAFADKAKVRKNRVAQIKEMVKFVLESKGIAKLDAGAYTFALQNNSQPSVIIDGDVPQNMNKVTIEPDKGKISEYLKEQPDQACPWAHLERGKHVRIR